MKFIKTTVFSESVRAIKMKVNGAKAGKELVQKIHASCTKRKSLLSWFFVQTILKHRHKMSEETLQVAQEDFVTDVSNSRDERLFFQGFLLLQTAQNFLIELSAGEYRGT